MSFLYRSSTRFTRSITRYSTSPRLFSTQITRMSQNLDSENISKITDSERKLSGQNEPIKGGPTAQAQKNAGQPINSDTLHDITEGEKALTGRSQPVKGGPTAAAQSILSSGSRSTSNTNNANATHSGKLDSETISRITEAEKTLTGAEGPVKGGPTAQAQKHVGENINSENLHDITEGEKKIASERVAGGPTATAQSELGKSRS